MGKILHWCALVLLLMPLVIKSQPLEEPLRLEKQEVDSIVHSLVHELKHTYLYPEKVSRFSTEVLSQLYQGKFYQGLTSEELQQELSYLLSSTTHNSDVEINWQPKAELFTQQSGAIKTEELEGNIGYFALSGSLDDLQAKPLFNDSFRALAKSDAIILDIRQADETTLNQALYLLSFFTASNSKVGLVTYNDKTETLVIDGSLQSELQLKVPVFVLSSAFVTGAWELMLNELKNKGAVVVGYTSMGVSELKRKIDLNPQISITMPYAQLSTLENASWADVGIEPDHEVKSEQAMDKVFELAIEALKKKPN